MTSVSPWLRRPDAVAALAPDQEVAAHYGDPYREQREFFAGRALTDRSNRSVVQVTGADRLRWLQGLTTQALVDLPTGIARAAAILSPHGHIEHLVTVVDDGSVTWLHTEPGCGDALVEFLTAMRFRMQVQVAEVTDAWAVVTVAEGDGGGGLAAEVPRRVPAAIPAPGGYDLTTAWGRAEASDQRLPALDDLLVPREALPMLADLPLAGLWAYDAWRVMAGLPRFGLESDHRTIPHELGLIGWAVTLDKGCYRGQETVARVHNLGRPPRRLVRLLLDGSVDRLPPPGAPVISEPGPQVGFVGTTVRHYELGPCALAVVKRNTPIDATLLVEGIPAAQEQIVRADHAPAVELPRLGTLAARGIRPLS